MRKFLWMQLPVGEGEGASGGGAPAATPPASGEPPANPPAGGEGSPTTPPAEPPANGSLVPESEGDAPPAEGAKPDAPPVPEPLDLAKLTLPEGMAADDPGLAKLGEILGNADLKPQERAQQLLDTYRSQAEAIATKAAEAVSDNYRKINADWQAEVKADPVIGGAKMQESLSVVAKALDTWGDGKALRRDLALTGMGNNPHFLRFVHKMATELGEGRPAQGGTPTGRKSMAEVMYGKPEEGAN